jgi:hypothetical protein
MGHNFLSAHGSMGRVIENVLAKGKQTHRTKPAAVTLPRMNRKTYRTQSRAMRGYEKGAKIPVGHPLTICERWHFT